MFYYDSKNLRLLVFENKKWILKQTLPITLSGGLQVIDINKDGFVDIINFSGRNMNGNQWVDLYMFNPDKVEYVKSNQNIFIGEFENDPASIGDWLAQAGQDADEFVKIVEELKKEI